MILCAIHWYKEFKSQDMIKVLHLSHDVHKGSVVSGTGMEPVTKPSSFLDTRAILKEWDRE